MSNTKWGCSFLLSLTLLLGACGNSGDGGGSVSEGSEGEGGSGDGEVTIDVYQFKVEFREQFEELIAQYEEENPDVNINVETRSEEHTSELQSRFDLVCRLLLEKEKKKLNNIRYIT